MDIFRPEAVERLRQIYGERDGEARYHDLVGFLRAAQELGDRVMPSARDEEALHQLLSARDEQGAFERVRIQHLLIRQDDPEVPKDFVSVGRSLTQLSGPLAERSQRLYRESRLGVSPRVYQLPACWVRVAAA